jgi:hypothetical protein
MEALKMETPMDNWNDDRLDELSRRVDEGFADVKEELRHLNGRIDRIMYGFFVMGGGLFGTALLAVLRLT